MDSKENLTSKPQDMTEEFNSFIKLVRDLRRAAHQAHGDPMEHLRNWMSTRGRVEVTHLSKIKEGDLREVMKSVEPGRSSGADNIDGFSIKLAYPLTENSLLHLVNLSLEKGRFAGA